MAIRVNAANHISCPSSAWARTFAKLRFAVAVLVCLLCYLPVGHAEETSAAQRGEKAITSRNFTFPAWSTNAYRNVWKHWHDGRKTPPENYQEAFIEHYGLHPAPYPNDDYPMGLRAASGLLGKRLSTDCLLCHGGSILGKSYVGLPNTSLEIQAFFEDLNAADGLPPKTPFRFGNVRGTSEAGGMAVFLLGFRNPDLSLRRPRLELGLRDDLCEDPPAWWLLKKKKTMYHVGSSDARSVRSIMQFMLSPLNFATSITREEETFADIRAYFLSLQAPKYPFAIDTAKAAEGERLFTHHCSRCHGTYGDKGTYPNKIVPLDKIGTDRTRYDGIAQAFGDYYNQTWFAQEKPGWFVDEYQARPTAGYQAPPLDGIWATAPYFHNGSVPTVYHVLNSKARPEIFTRSYRTDRESYDPEKIGWKIRIMKFGAHSRMPAIEQRKIYDTRIPGRGNQGHPFGDDLTEEERWAVIEYLKTL